MRRNRALLATYTSEKDIEEQRARALADNQKAVREQEARVADLKKRRAGFDKELEFYQDKSGKTKAAAQAAGGDPPGRLRPQGAAGRLLETKKKEVEQHQRQVRRRQEALSMDAA